MSYSILLVVEKPDPSVPETESKWRKFLEYTSAMQNSDVRTLGTNILLIGKRNTLNNLRTSLVRCEGLNYKYTVLPGVEWRGPAHQI